MSTPGLVPTWEPTQHRTLETVETSVKLDGAPDITWERKSRHAPGRGRPYTIRFQFTRHNGGPWQSSITIYAQRPDGIVGDWFSPEKVLNSPQWLTDLIAQATPGVEVTT